jgi:putative ABC transport system ATP-binding protein
MILTAKNLSKKYQQGDRKVQVFSDLNLELSEGQSLAIVGPSGSGKSTLLSLLAGLDQPDQGEIQFKGRDLTKLTADELSELRKKNISMVYQQFHLFKHLTALENVALPLELLGEEGARDKAKELLEQVGLKDRVTHFPHELSGGECQRVAIARALIHKPDLILADEPSGNLDVKTGEQVMNLMFDLVKKQGTSIVLVTHNPQLAELCDRTFQFS